MAVITKENKLTDNMNRETNDRGAIGGLSVNAPVGDGIHTRKEYDTLHTYDDLKRWQDRDSYYKLVDIVIDNKKQIIIGGVVVATIVTGVIVYKKWFTKEKRQERRIKKLLKEVGIESNEQQTN